MQCPMCYDLYNSEQRTPRNLSCGHTVCEQCLTIVYEQKKYLECPTCRFKHDSQTKPSILTKNYIALQLACQKKQIRRKHEFCPEHDEPYKFYCEDDAKYLCVECISEHIGHHFVKKDQNFFATKKAFTTEIQCLEKRNKNLQEIDNQFHYVKESLFDSYNDTIMELDNMFNTIKNRLTEQHCRSKEELNKFKDKQLAEIETKQKQVAEQIISNEKQRQRIIEIVKDIDKDHHKVYEKMDTIEEFKKLVKPSIIQFPALVMPYTGNESFVQICHKVNPKICCFGERKKLLTLCPINNVYSLTTINNAEIQYFASACTLPTGEIFITGGGSSNHCFMYSPCKEPNMLEKKKSMMNARKQHSCVYLNGKVYVISGYDGKNKGMAGCEAYDIFRQEWREIKGLNIPRCAFAATVCAGKIYVFGGYDGKDRLPTIQVFNPATGNWTLLSSQLQFSLSNAAAVSGGTKIYILGGGWQQGFNQQILQFDTQTHRIMVIERMHKGRDLRNKAIKFKNEIFTLGGNFLDGEKLSLRARNWTDLKPYSDLVNDNLDSWCCALSYNSHEYLLEKCQEMSKSLQEKYMLQFEEGEERT